MKQQNANATLTDRESAFAAEHHNLIYRYLREKKLSEDEYYDVVVFGYLNGVKKHFRRKDLRRYPFTVLAWRAMDACFANNTRAKLRLKRKGVVLSLQERQEDAGVLEELIADTQNVIDDLVERLAVEETCLSFDEMERRIVSLLLEEYPKSTIANMLGINMKELHAALCRIQIKTLDSPLMQAVSSF